MRSKCSNEDLENIDVENLTTIQDNLPPNSANSEYQEANKHPNN